MSAVNAASHVDATVLGDERKPENFTAARELRVFVISDVRIYREALVASLAARKCVKPVGASDSADAAVQLAALRPDIVLLDIGVLSSPALPKLILEILPEAKTVAMGVSEADHAVLTCAAAGVSGFAPKHASSDELVAIMEGVMRGELVCSPRIAASLYHRLGSYCVQPSRPGPLTRRELQIIELVDMGFSNKEIGRQLRIGTSTVKNHVHHILEKLDVRRRGEAAARIRSGLLGMAGSNRAN